MAYNINLLTNVSIQKKKYFLDANVWLLILAPKSYNNPAEAKYIDFFNQLHKHHLNPRIVITGQLLSEIINRYLRDIGFKTYCANNPLVSNASRNDRYKSEYRQTEQFKIDYDIICSDIKAFHNSCELCSDGFGQDIQFKHLLKNPIKGLDFNDHYACLLAKREGFAIVTHDIDFFIEDVEVITCNQKLYEKMKNTITPNSK